MLSHTQKIEGTRSPCPSSIDAHVADHKVNTLNTVLFDVCSSCELSGIAKTWDQIFKLPYTRMREHTVK